MLVPEPPIRVQPGKGIAHFLIFLSISGFAGLWGYLGSIDDFEDFGRFRIFQVSILPRQNDPLKDPKSLKSSIDPR